MESVFCFAWHITPSTTLKTMISKGFRGPIIWELYMLNYNTGLIPERIMSYETGISRSFLNEKLKAELTGYITDGDKLIVTGAMGHLYNSVVVMNKGIEIALNASPVKHLSLNLSYSYIHIKTPLFAASKTQFLHGWPI